MAHLSAMTLVSLKVSFTGLISSLTVDIPHLDVRAPLHQLAMVCLSDTRHITSLAFYTSFVLCSSLRCECCRSVAVLTSPQSFFGRSSVSSRVGNFRITVWSLTEIGFLNEVSIVIDPMDQVARGANIKTRLRDSVNCGLWIIS